MFGRFCFRVLNTVDNAVSRWRPKSAEGYIPGGSWDKWDSFLEKANMVLWPEYDGEGWFD